MTKTKPALILIHGFRGAPLGLEEVAKPLREAGYSVYIPAIPPYAGAPELDAYSPKSYANFIKNYIEENNLYQPILIGHSMGSVIAAATAECFPEAVSDKLFLLAPISIKPPKFFRFISPLSDYLPLNVVDYVTTRYLYTKQPNHDSFSRIMDLTHRCSHSAPPNRSSALAVTKFSTNYCVADFKPKKAISIIVGDHDTLIKRSATEALAKSLSAKITFIPSSGHLHIYEQPRNTAMAILNDL